MRKLGCCVCKHAQQGVKHAGVPGEAEVQQASWLNSHATGPIVSMVSRSSLVSAPCLTLGMATRRAGSSPQEPDYQRRCFATKAQSRTYYYDVLCVSPKATQAEIKSAYYRLSKVYHPDINKKDESKMFAEISEAYEVLSNTKKRRMYDHGIFSRNEPPVDDHDYTQSFRQREGFGFERQAPPTGRTSKYNFDEFYRQHYGNAVKQERAEREYMKQMEQQADAEEMERKLRIIVTGSVILSLVVMFFINSGIGPGKRPELRNTDPRKK